MSLKFYRALAEGKLCPRVDSVYPMEGYIDAWRYVTGSRGTYGKVVIETGV